MRFNNIEKLKGRKFIVGRNPNGSGWFIKEIGGTHKVAAFGTGENVPKCVSRLMQLDNNAWTAHYKIDIVDIDQSEQVLISNLKPEQHTFVNGEEIATKIVNPGDQIELGGKKYAINLQLAIDAATKMVSNGGGGTGSGGGTGIYSIAPLKDVWEEYERRQDAVQKRRKNINLLSRIPIAFTMVGGLASGLCPEEYRPYLLIFTAVALIMTIYGIYMSMTYDDIGEARRNQKFLQDNYKCPGCGHTLPSQPYDVLRQNTNCPYNKCKWVS